MGGRYDAEFLFFQSASPKIEITTKNYGGGEVLENAKKITRKVRTLK